MEEREYLNLPLKYGDIREDGAKFISYYYNINTNTNYKSRPLEQWIFKENIEKQKQTKAEHKRKTATANRNFIRRLKRLYGCSICGYKKSLDALCFHHIRDKKYIVSRMLQNSRKSLKEEIRKCILVCHNCHSEIHEQERNNQKENDDGYTR